MRKCCLCVVLALVAGWCAAQENDLVRAAMYLSGASSPEEVPDDYVEQLQGARRVRVNSPGLRPGLLLSAWQVACIRDYRSRYGDILSWEELALVDGFSQEAVEALRPFLSLESDRSPGSVDTLRLRATVLARGTLSSVGAKAKVTGADWRAGGAWRGKDWTVHGEYNSRYGRVLIGDYHLRLGQGLLAWSGVQMNSLSTVDAFLLRPTGLSPSWSYSSAYGRRGLAYAYSGIHASGLVFGNLDGSYGAHGAWTGRRAQAGVTVLSEGRRWAFSADAFLNLRGHALAAEVAWRQGSFAARAGWKKKLGEQWKLAAQGRWLPSAFSGRKNGEYALAAGGAWQAGRRVQLFGKNGFGSSVPRHRLSLTLDGALLPIPGTDQRRVARLHFFHGEPFGD